MGELSKYLLLLTLLRVLSAHRHHKHHHSNHTYQPIADRESSHVTRTLVPSPSVVESESRKRKLLIKQAVDELKNVLQKRTLSQETKSTVLSKIFDSHGDPKKESLAREIFREAMAPADPTNGAVGDLGAEMIKLSFLSLRKDDKDYDVHHLKSDEVSASHKSQISAKPTHPKHHRHLSKKFETHSSKNLDNNVLKNVQNYLSKKFESKGEKLLPNFDSKKASLVKKVESTKTNLSKLNKMLGYKPTPRRLSRRKHRRLILDRLFIREINQFLKNSTGKHKDRHRIPTINRTKTAKSVENVSVNHYLLLRHSLSARRKTNNNSTRSHMRAQLVSVKLHNTTRRNKTDKNIRQRKDFVIELDDSDENDGDARSFDPIMSLIEQYAERHNNDVSVIDENDVDDGYVSSQRRRFGENLFFQNQQYNQQPQDQQQEEEEEEEEEFSNEFPPSQFQYEESPYDDEAGFFPGQQFTPLGDATDYESPPIYDDPSEAYGGGPSNSNNNDETPLYIPRDANKRRSKIRKSNT